MKLFTFISLLISCCSFAQVANNNLEIAVNQTLDNWHKAAAEANFEVYFSYMTNEGVFIGTDPTENWQNEAFKSFSKPYFDNGKAWSFTMVQRNIYFSTDKKIAWFDELLSTQMKLCRGSGVLIKLKGKWKIAHYVLSITIPNENSAEVIKIKSIFDDDLVRRLK